jgi:hypothetical protein
MDIQDGYGHKTKVAVKKHDVEHILIFSASISCKSHSNPRSPRIQKRMIASIANMSCPRRVPLSHGLALQAYSYRSSGRVEINSLKR